jgi:hypothetical protein
VSPGITPARTAASAWPASVAVAPRCLSLPYRMSTSALERQYLHSNRLCPGSDVDVSTHSCALIAGHGQLGSDIGQRAGVYAKSYS